MDKASIIKAVKDVSIIVIAGIVIYFIISAIEKKKCNCSPTGPTTAVDENGDLVVTNPPVATR